MFRFSLLVVLLCCDVAAFAQQPPSTIEYEVRVVELYSTTKFDADVKSNDRAKLLEKIAAWQKAGIIRRMTLVKLTGVDGGSAMGEMQEVRRIQAEQGRFGGRLKDEKILIPATEQLTTRVTIEGRIDKDVIVVKFISENQVETDPDTVATFNPGETKPAIWKRNSSGGSETETTISVKSGENICIGGVVSASGSIDDENGPKTYRAQQTYIWARIVK